MESACAHVCLCVFSWTAAAFCRAYVSAQWLGQFRWLLRRGRTPGLLGSVVAVVVEQTRHERAASRIIVASSRLGIDNLYVLRAFVAAGACLCGLPEASLSTTYWCAFPLAYAATLTHCAHTKTPDFVGSSSLAPIALLHAPLSLRGCWRQLQKISA